MKTQVDHPWFVLEDLNKPSHHRLFTLLGVDWLATSYAWLSLPLYVALGLLAAFLANGGSAVEARLLTGLGYGLLIDLTNLPHSLGHILSGKLVGAPMDANLVTATFHVNLYQGDQSGYSKLVHIGRSLGGPLGNLLVGLISLGVGKLVAGDGLSLFGMMNVVVAIFLLAPTPSLDGWVIWGELLGFRPFHR